MRESKVGPRAGAGVRGLVLLAAMGGWAASAQTADGLHHSAIVPGGGTVTQGDTRLHYTIGEPVSGVVETGRWRLIAGFQALFPAVVGDSDVIFTDGFDAAGP
ncbi:hypothetical protein [Pseudofulvimonas gallinarii]|jgi:hypothetical protein|uniref:Uncharacterized protein n=1 Tax=Pseudofulvimonas gallinarii TaxID=634155 RepID=A0A4R3LM63_9GAMM|nr:hypothetical protein [Pseudofulvimonas gallinarii]TCT01392.1 hypothetical protein EDC25_101259 [Pseudofulvimonas gallinarii]THD15144.1 hypothetical protein B1808_01780 [Pseudofulvimonas gallinarii]